MNPLLVLVVVVVHTHLVVLQKRRVAAKCILGTETCVEITSCKDEGGWVGVQDIGRPSLSADKSHLRCTSLIAPKLRE